jgi:hypothetical protein
MMKKYILIIYLITSITISYAQDTTVYKTIFGDLETTGVYYGINAKTSIISGKYIADFGMNMAFIVNNNITFGIQGNGFWQQPQYDQRLNKNFNIQGLYGGLFIEPIIFPFYAFHFTIPVYFGGGVIDFCEVGNNILNNSDYYTYDEDVFVFVEPGIEIELNVIEKLRISLGAHYKYTSDISLADNINGIIFPPTVLSNVNFGLTLKYGSFYN